MNYPPPTTTASLSTSTQSLPNTTTIALIQLTSGVSTALPTMTNEKLTTSLLHFSNNLGAIQARMMALQSDVAMLEAVMLGSQPPPSLPSPSEAVTALSSLLQPALTATPTSSQPLSVPIHQLHFPRSPSQILAWALGSDPPLIYSSTTSITTTVPQPPAPTTALGPCGGAQPPGARYQGVVVDGTLFAPSRGASSSRSQEQLGFAMHCDPMPPKFYKFEFTTYDGLVDPLNRLNHCEQFFCGQKTLASNRTWLASYHLRDAVQTWYYTLEQDVRMPMLERFKELCHLQFGPPFRDSRLAELGRLQFRSTVQEFT
jgi:hypothetical protein